MLADVMEREWLLRPQKVAVGAYVSESERLTVEECRDLHGRLHMDLAAHVLCTDLPPLDWSQWVPVDVEQWDGWWSHWRADHARSWWAGWIARRWPPRIRPVRQHGRAHLFAERLAVFPEAHSLPQHRTLGVPRYRYTQPTVDFDMQLSGGASR